jgi:signal peptidase I
VLFRQATRFYHRYPMKAVFEKAVSATTSVLFAVSTVYMCRKYLFDIVRLEGSSMAPTINENVKDTYVFIDKVSATGGLEPGRIIILKSPYEPDKILCKRVKAVVSSCARYFC